MLEKFTYLQIMIVFPEKPSLSVINPLYLITVTTASHKHPTSWLCSHTTEQRAQEDMQTKPFSNINRPALWKDPRVQTSAKLVRQQQSESP